MTVDRDRADDAGAKLPTLVFRPWPRRPATVPSPAHASIRPCFVRLPPPTMTGAASPDASEPVAAPDAAATDDQDQRRTNRAARPPRFARFVTALQSRAGALGQTPALWGADPWADAQARAAVRPPASPAEAGGLRLLPGRSAALAAVERGLHRLAVRRSALLIGAASAAAFALVALFDPSGGQDRAQLVGPPVGDGGLVRAPPTPDRYRSAPDRRAASMPGPLLIANRPPSIEVGDPPPATPEPPTKPTRPAPVTAVDAAIPETGGPPTDPAPPGSVAVVDATIPGKTEPPADPAPAPASLARLSATAPPGPPRIEDATAGLAADGKFAALAVHAGTLREPAPADDDPLYDLAHRLQEKGDVAQAIEAYRMAAEANPQHASTWYDWGYLLQQQGDEDGARQKYLVTLRFAPRHAFAHYNLGYILQKHGDDADAIKHYRAAIAANPAFFWSWYNLGYIRQKQGQYRAALADYRKSIEIDPKHALSYENIATILRYHRTD